MTNEGRITTDSRDDRLAYGYADAARRTGLSTRTLRRHVATGRLRARKCGGRVVILHRDLMTYLEGLPDVTLA